MITVSAQGKEFTFEDGTTNEQIGAAVDEYFAGSITPAEKGKAEKSTGWRIAQGLADISSGKALAEVGQTIASGAIAEPVAGYAGALDAAFHGADSGAETVKTVRDALTMQPKTEVAQGVINAIGTVAGTPLAAVDKGLGYVGEKIGGAAGRTIGENISTPILEILGFKGTRAAKRAALAAEIKKNPASITPEVQKVLEDQGLGDVAELVDPKQAERLERFSQFDTKPTQGELTQKLEDLKPEQMLLESSVDETGKTLQSMKRDQSAAIRASVDKTIDSLGVPAEVGSSVKEILINRKKVLKETRRNAYEQLSQAAEGQNIPVITNNLLDGMPDKGRRRTIEKTAGNQSAPGALKELLNEFGIENDAAEIKRLTDAGVEITPLSLGNFEAFRRRLGDISESDPTGQMDVLAGPIRKNLDAEIDLMTSALEKSGSPNVSELAKQARQSNIALKTEFDPKSITEKLISKKTNSVLPTVEESKVYQTVAANSLPVEEVTRLVDSIEATGSKKAIGDLQSAMLLDLIDSAFSANTRKIDDVPIFGGSAFQNRYKVLEPKIEVIFRSNPEALQRIKALNQVAKDLTIDSRAMPKGSAGFFIDQLQKLGFNPIMSKIGAGAGIEALTHFSKLSRNRKALHNAMKAKPELRETANVLATDYPGLAAALGIGYLASEKESSSGSMDSRNR